MQARLIGVAAFIVGALCGASPAWAAEGDLDPGFGTGGTVATPFAPAQEVNAVTIDGQGRLIVVGTVHVVDSEIGVARYLPTGALDTSFGAGGTAIFDFPVAASIENGNAVALDAQGRILIAGYVQTTNVVDFALIRLTPDGVIDSSFGPPGSNGYVRQPVFSSDDTAHAVAVDSQGRIVVGGTSAIGGDNDFSVVRFDANGSLDTSFGTGGRASVDFTPFAGDRDEASAMAIDGQGRILLAGVSDTATTNDEFALARLTGDGLRDASFGPPANAGSEGQVSTPIGSRAEISAITFDSQGRIVAAGGGEDGTGFQFALARYNADGSPDATFSDDGTLLTSLQEIPGGFEEALGVGIDSQGRIVAAGLANDGVAETSLALARYQPDGALDATFGTGGKVLVTGRDGAGVAFDAQERIVVASMLIPGGGADRQFGAARFIGDAVPPAAATIGTGPAEGAVINDPTPTFEFTGSEANGTFACGFEGASAPCSSPFTPGAPLSDGQHTLGVIAIDRAGNSAASTTRTFTVDTVAPEIEIDGKKKFKTDEKKAKAKLKLSTSEPAETTCAVDKKPAKPCDEKFKAKLKLGKHKVTVTATDQAGNASDEAKKIKVVQKP